MPTHHPADAHPCLRGRRPVHCVLLWTAVALLASCATNDNLQGTEANIDVHAIVAQRGVARPNTSVAIIDLRETTTQERTGFGAMSMGTVTFNPGEVDLVRQIVEAKVTEVLAEGTGQNGSERIAVGIRAFHVTTPATLLYWDVTTRVVLVLRVRGRDKTAAGSAMERTYTWPGKHL